jgi:uncharacterized membrane protein
MGCGGRRFVLRPRCSLTPTTARNFLLLIGGTTFAVATFFAWHGFWPILPFAGLEIGLLTLALRLSLRAGQVREIITISTDSITLERCDSKGSCSTVFPRHWAAVKLRAPHATLHPSRLTIESHGRACEVGRFLTEDERRGLARRLQQLVGKVNESPALN